jgi:hypothetical protein
MKNPSMNRNIPQGQRWHAGSGNNRLKDGLSSNPDGRLHSNISDGDDLFWNIVNL